MVHTTVEHAQPASPVWSDAGEGEVVPGGQAGSWLGSWVGGWAGKRASDAGVGGCRGKRVSALGPGTRAGWASWWAGLHALVKWCQAGKLGGWVSGGEGGGGGPHVCLEYFARRFQCTGCCLKLQAFLCQACVSAAHPLLLVPLPRSPTLP